jgi:5'-deoxynucleotidase YfbR-like HD superfamily hydrolase
MAMEKVIGDLIKKEEYLALLNEFDERKTKESIFAYHCDKLEADIQAKVYQGMGVVDAL